MAFVYIFVYFFLLGDGPDGPSEAERENQALDSSLEHRLSHANRTAPRCDNGGEKGNRLFFRQPTGKKRAISDWRGGQKRDAHTECTSLLELHKKADVSLIHPTA